MTLIFGYQLYWLLNLYGTQTRLMEVRILEVIRASDYNEMILRVKKLRDTGVSGNVSVSAGLSKNSNQTYLQSSASVHVSTNNESDSLFRNSRQHQTLKDSVQNDTVSTATSAAVTGQGGMAMILEKQHNTEQLAVYFQQGLHSGLDMVTEPNLLCFDSLLTVRLNELGIDTRHRLFHIRRGNNLDSSYTYIDTLNALCTPGYQPSIQARIFEHTIAPKQGQSYLLQMEPVGGYVLRQMTGILVTSLVILSILGFSFWYLIRTLLKQKSLEEMKSDFTNNITHELKTPIAVAYAANDALLNFDQGNDPQQRNKYLRICREQLSHLSQLVEQILSMSMERRKGFTLHCEELSLSELLPPLIEQHKLKAGKPVTVSCDILPANLSVNADRTHFSNIVSNLLDNAIKYSPQEAHIHIKAHRDKEGKTVFSVSDQGIGISLEQRQRIFNKFYRVPHGNRHDVKGYGLGLYYVKTMVEKHGGTIAVESEQGKGSTFVITI